jgi:hypothetical protein
MITLKLADSKYLRPANRAGAPYCRSTVLQGDPLRVFDFPLLSALKAIGCWHDDLLSVKLYLPLGTMLMGLSAAFPGIYRAVVVLSLAILYQCFFLYS